MYDGDHRRDPCEDYHNEGMRIMHTLGDLA